jgi:hypothetical protein
MKLNQNIINHEELHLEGIYKISNVYLEDCKYKENRSVVFPMRARVGERLLFAYVKYYGHESHNSLGRTFISHPVVKIQTLKNNKYSIQITTDDNQWILTRLY